MCRSTIAGESILPLGIELLVILQIESSRKKYNYKVQGSLCGGEGKRGNLLNKAQLLSLITS